MNRPLRPNDLTPAWFARWEERTSIVQKCNNLPTDIEGARKANQIAFEMTLREMREENGRRQKQ
jgi:hypothetical protein